MRYRICIFIFGQTFSKLTPAGSCFQAMESSGLSPTATCTWELRSKHSQPSLKWSDFDDCHGGASSGFTMRLANVIERREHAGEFKEL